MSETKSVNLLAAAIAWFNANAAKNAATSAEKKARTILEVALANSPEETFPISDTLDLKVGWRDVKDEEVDAQKLFKENPNLFWSLVSIPKTALVTEIGEKGAAKLMRPIKKHVFKLEKIKKAKE